MKNSFPTFQLSQSTHSSNHNKTDDFPRPSIFFFLPSLLSSFSLSHLSTECAPGVPSPPGSGVSVPLLLTPPLQLPKHHSTSLSASLSKLSKLARDLQLSLEGQSIQYIQVRSHIAFASSLSLAFSLRWSPSRLDTKENHKSNTTQDSTTQDTTTSSDSSPLHSSSFHSLTVNPNPTSHFSSFLPPDPPTNPLHLSTNPTRTPFAGTTTD